MRRFMIRFLTFMLAIASAWNTNAAVTGRVNVQGRLTDSTGAPLPSGNKTLSFSVHDADVGGVKIWPAVLTEDQVVTTGAEGLWTVFLGSVYPLTDSVFSDSTRWLEITVNDGVNPPETMPRVRLVTGPFAFRVATVDGATGGNITSSLTVGAGHGTVGEQCFVSGTQNTADSYQSSVGAGRNNQVNADQSFIGGGYRNSIIETRSMIGAGSNNTVAGTSGAVTAGEYNVASGSKSFIGAGQSNQVHGVGSCIVSGFNNTVYDVYSGVFTGSSDTVRASYGAVLAGQGNRAGSEFTTYGAVVCGGFENKANSHYSFIGNGRGNRSYGDQAVIVGGEDNLVEAHYSAILYGHSDTITSTAKYSYLFGHGSKLTEDSTFMVDMPHIRLGSEFSGYELPSVDGAPGQVLATDGSGTVGWSSPTSSSWTLTGDVLATDGNWGIIRGGAGNSYYGVNALTMTNFGSASQTGVNGYNSSYCTVGGGNLNLAQSDGATVAGGVADSVFGNGGAILGGQGNRVNGAYSVIGGGVANQAAGLESAILGGKANYTLGLNSVIGAGLADSVRSKYSGILSGFSNAIDSDIDSASFIGSGVGNTVSASLSVIGGGRSNTVTGPEAVIVGGYNNSVTASGGAICGGVFNAAGEAAGTMSGWDNAATGRRSFIGGGAWNRADGQYGAILGGANNRTSGLYASVGGGERNDVQGDHAVIPGGYRDTLGAAANISMAFGNSVYLNTSYRVGFFDGSASGRLGVNRDDPDGGIGFPIHVGTNATNGNGAHLTNGGTWVNGSSRDYKDCFHELDPDSVLQAIEGMPIQRWSYRGTQEQHIGPVAEDFVEAFDVGTMNEDGTRDVRYLSPADLAGIALIAIKELDRRTRRIAELESELEAIRHLVAELAAER